MFESLKARAAIRAAKGRERGASHVSKRERTTGRSRTHLCVATNKSSDLVGSECPNGKSLEGGNSFVSHADRGRAQDDVGLMGESDSCSSGENGTVNDA